MASRTSYKINPLAMELAYTSRTIIDSAISKVIEQFKDVYCKTLFNQTCKHIDLCADTNNYALVHKGYFLYLSDSTRHGPRDTLNLPLELWEQGDFAITVIDGLTKLSKQISQSVSEYSAKGKTLIIYESDLLKSLPIHRIEFDMEYDQEELDALNEKLKPLLDELNYYKTFLLL